MVNGMYNRYDQGRREVLVAVPWIVDGMAKGELAAREPCPALALGV